MTSGPFLARTQLSARGVPAQEPGQLVTVDAMQMCTEVRRRALGGRWSYANSGVFAGTASGLRASVDDVVIMDAGGGERMSA